jgi:hypothetical protein
MESGTLETALAAEQAAVAAARQADDAAAQVVVAEEAEVGAARAVLDGLKAQLLTASPKDKTFAEKVRLRMVQEAVVEAQAEALRRAQEAREATRAKVAVAERREQEAELEIRCANIAAQGEALTAEAEAWVAKFIVQLAEHDSERQRADALSRLLGRSDSKYRLTVWMAPAALARSSRGAFHLDGVAEALESIRGNRRALAEQAAEVERAERRRHHPVEEYRGAQGFNVGLAEALRRRGEAPPVSPDYPPQIG